MKKRELDAFVAEILVAFDEAKMTRATLLVSILRIRVMNDFVQVADALLSELDPEGLARRVKKDDDGDSDVRLADDETALQSEALRADSEEDLTRTLDEKDFERLQKKP